jgi:hypothetical protein
MAERLAELGLKDPNEGKEKPTRNSWPRLSSKVIMTAW